MLFLEHALQATHVVPCLNISITSAVETWCLILTVAGQSGANFNTLCTDSWLIHINTSAFISSLDFCTSTKSN